MDAIKMCCYSTNRRVDFVYGWLHVKNFTNNMWLDTCTTPKSNGKLKKLCYFMVMVGGLAGGGDPSVCN